jgi:hypothetical protein
MVPAFMLPAMSRLAAAEEPDRLARAYLRQLYQVRQMLNRAADRRRPY